MPVHNWKRVSSGTFHDFHTAWIGELRRVLNTGLLPPKFYALAEQIAGEIGPDVLALHSPDEPAGNDGDSDRHGGLMVAEAPPKVSIRSEATEAILYAKKRETLVIRHSSGDDVVALIEIVSPGNKQGRTEVRHFVDKARSALDQRIHLLIVDLFPPGRSDPQGLHGEIWSGLGDEEFVLPPDKPLTLASYVAKLLPVAYIEPIAVGAELPEMPLFLETDRYINVPLEATYRAAYEGVPERWRRVIEGRDGS
jgi:Protein of unknown function (DUF4058)